MPFEINPHVLALIAHIETLALFENDDQTVPALIINRSAGWWVDRDVHWSRIDGRDRHGRTLVQYRHPDGLGFARRGDTLRPEGAAPPIVGHG